MKMFISYKQLLQVYRVLSRGHKIIPIYVKINKKCITFLFRRKWSEPLNIGVLGISEVDSIGGSSGCASFFKARKFANSTVQHSNFTKSNICTYLFIPTLT